MEKEGMIPGQQTCFYEGKQFQKGSELCEIDGGCMECVNGRWEDKVSERYPAA
jgi:hypothetical protein